MQPRIDFYTASPDAMRAMMALEGAVNKLPLEKNLLELVKMRTSQINGCAFCLDMHSADARKAGETERRLYTLSAWREAPFFSARERAALAWTEALTRIAESHAPDEDYERLNGFARCPRRDRLYGGFSPPLSLFPSRASVLECRYLCQPDGERPRMYSQLQPPALPAAFHSRIYAGEVFALALPAMVQLIETARGLLEEALYPFEPTRIHRHLDHVQQAQCFTLGDSAPRDRATATIAFHRDTWGSNLYAQTNWWAPIYPISAARTFALYPQLWERALANSSADFDLSHVLQRSHRDGRNSVDADQAIPHLLESIDGEVAVPVVIDPGSLLAFSGAHAHAGVPNHTELTRISFETRTVWIDDVLAGRGAPNVDGRAPWRSPGFFRRLSDGRRLHEVLGCNYLDACR